MWVSGLGTRPTAVGGPSGPPLEPFTCLMERRSDGIGCRRLRRLLFLDRRPGRDGAADVLTEQRRVLAPFSEREIVERPSFLQQPPDHTPDDLVRVAKRHAARN